MVRESQVVLRSRSLKACDRWVVIGVVGLSCSAAVLKGLMFFKIISFDQYGLFLYSVSKPTLHLSVGLLFCISARDSRS
ncbi:hypothetical protein EDB80DRAFT_718372 [Ilyonectria destructans]|nr:hypothetical protein EDB80DRAFT_718372 [Ilyonectria destructans]